MGKSRFGLNLFLQFLLIWLLETAFGMAWMWGVWVDGVPLLKETLRAFSSIISFSFVCGIIYGIFRLLGLRSGFLEFYYQHFPVGIGEAFRPEPASEVKEPDILATSPKEQTGFNWDSLFTPKYLRYAGFLLVVSAIFSMLFRIDWQLIHKTIASFALAGISIIFAEQFRRKERIALASTFMLVGFAAFQFACTLLAKLYLRDHIAPVYFPEYVLFAKLAISIAMLPLLRRYYSDFAYPCGCVPTFPCRNFSRQAPTDARSSRGGSRGSCGGACAVRRTFIGGNAL